MNILDLTQTISQDMPVYPGTEQPKLEPASTYERDKFRETLLTMFSHTGTHMDAPAHIIPGRTTLDSFAASQFVGSALVVDCRELNAGDVVTLWQRRRGCRISAVLLRLGQILGQGRIFR